ncbi:MAG: hypothetical protein Q9227_004940 [Pyrenula ochraceoflavens]
MAGPQPPYALFVTTDGVDVAYINKCLTRAWEGNFKAAWFLYVAESYDGAPRKRTDNEISEGTKAPMSDFQSPFLDCSLEECAKWLQSAPDEISLQREYFTALDQFSKEDDTILLCRYVETHTEGQSTRKLQYFPVPTSDAVMSMQNALGLKFDEKLQNYQRSRMKDGKPDRSKG